MFHLLVQSILFYFIFFVDKTALQTRNWHHRSKFYSKWEQGSTKLDRITKNPLASKTINAKFLVFSVVQDIFRLTISL